jgi:tetratricopeptide (TPR) repeat protein
VATTEDDLDSGRWGRTVRTFNGPRTIELSIPSLIDAKHRLARGRRGAVHALPDRRLLERTLQDIQRIVAGREFGSLDEANAFMATQVGREPAHAAPVTPQERARELVYRALEASGRLRIKLARDAIGLWPDCADAWVIRAEEMPDLALRLGLYRQATEAGERALGPARFAEDAGHFWGVLDTRPYMRARHGLADSLWQAGQRDEAVAHWVDMMRLNPGDNQGVRHRLLPRLLELGRDDEAAALLLTLDDELSSTPRYVAALLAFRRDGDTEVAQERLAVARRLNPHVSKYLIGNADLPGLLPESYRLGSDEEAQLTASYLQPAWSATAGAVEWLRHARRQAKVQRGRDRAGRRH